MLQQKMSWGPSHAVDDWNPRSLSNFQTFPRAAGGSLSSSAEENSSSPEQETRHNNHGFVPSHSHSKSLVVDDKDKINKTSLPIKGHQHSRSLGGEAEAQGLPSLLNGTHLKDPAEDGDVVVIRLGHNDRRFGFSVVGGQEECFAPRIDEISKGSPADKADLEVGDEILEVNGKSLEGASHTEVISHIHQCIRSRTICLRVKRKSGTKLAQDLAAHSNVQDAFVIAVEQQAKERLERLSALKKIKPVDMSELSQQLSSETSSQSSQDFPPLSTKLVTFTDKSSESDREFKSDSAASQEELYESTRSEGTLPVPQAENAIVLRLKNSEDQVGGVVPSPLRPSPSVISPFGSPSTWVAPELDDSASTKVIEAPDDFRGSPDGHHVSHVTDIPVALVRPPWEDYGHVTEITVNESPELKKRERLLETSEARLSGSQDALNRTSRASDSDPDRSAGAESQPLSTNPRWAASRNSDRSSAAFSSSQESVMGTSREGGQTGSGSRPHSQRSSSTRDGTDSLMNMNVNVNHAVIPDWDTGPHREMAVDVPDTFIARTKTPPRYPPPKPLGQAHHNNNNNGNLAKKSSSGGGALPVAVNGTAGKPVPPPRDHLRIEEDGRLVNRAQAPQVPAKPKDERPATSPKRQADSANGPSAEEPSREQLERIRKYQEELRKRKELEERQAREEELLRSSLRGSRKLQALESSPSSSPLPLATPPPPSSGVLNSGYSLDQEEDEAYNSHVLANLPKIIGVAELTAALQRVQQQLKKNGLIQGQQALEADLAVVQTLLASPDFRAALALQAKVEELFCVGQPRVPIHNDVENLVSECIADLQHVPIPDAAELVDLLGTYEVEGLLYAHDKIAQRAALPPPPYSDADGADVDVDGRQPLPQPLKVLHTPPEVPLQQLGDKIVKIIKIEKTNEPLGATVRNEGDAVVVGRIVRGGAAERSGLLHENDEILEVNNIEMRGKSVNEVCDLLAGMTGTLTFMVVPTRDNKSAIQPAPTLMHVKAHFDYDPEEDLYIPCRELGISFQKGDILHVISQEDPNWWQAYREGEEDQTLAGLIPSKNFQQQREAMKQTIVTDSMDKEKSNKSNFLCAKKHQKKKKKKVLYNANFSDDFDAEEVLTYEEVALYYPRANHKRPIVLIGPPNIGRHELRQRLMQDAERFAAAIPHTSRPKKDNEVDGQDYHFISRAQFEADILSRKFVEHGEYEKAYYGTSVDAIRSVVNRNKICVLNLHPQSLKLLRTSDLKPFIVFVAPPSLEKLRQKKIQRNEPFKDDELKDIIEKAREMEEVYGHYFDMVIVNADDDRAYTQLLGEINVLEREPQWVPASWLRHEHA